MFVIRKIESLFKFDKLGGLVKSKQYMKLMHKFPQILFQPILDPAAATCRIQIVQL